MTGLHRIQRLPNYVFLKTRDYGMVFTVLFDRINELIDCVNQLQEADKKKRSNDK